MEPDDWDADYAFGEWASEHGAPPDVLAKILRLNGSEEYVRAFPLLYTAFQADRSTAWFLRAVDGMRAMRELAEYAISLLPKAAAVGAELAVKREIAEREAREIEERLKRQAEGRKRGGRISAVKQQTKAKGVRAKIHSIADELLEAGKEKWEISGMIEKRTGLTRQAVLNHLRDHSSALWAKDK